jgi:hypothetical protein
MATPQPSSQPQPPSRRYSLIFGVALTVSTLLALLVAFFSSDFRMRASNALPATWTQAYNADLTGTDNGAWDETRGCSMNALGLDASASDASDAQCAFTPSVQQSVTAGGFYFVTQLAPAAKVPAYARSVVSVGAIGDPSAPSGSVIRFIVTQDGAYTLCDGDCSSSGSAIYLHGGLASWHGDALVANTIAVKVSPDHSALTVFVNDQQVATVAPQLGSQPVIAVGALAGSEALFTHATLYTGQ